MIKLIFIIILIFLIVIILRHYKKPKNYLISNNNINYSDGLYWINLELSNGIFRSILDTGSNLVIVKGSTCTACDPGDSIPVDLTNPNYFTASYGGGQKIKYINETIYSPQFGKNIQVSVIKSGSNPQGSVNNILGLLNSSLGINTLTLDFPNNIVKFGDPLKRLGKFTNLSKSVYLSFEISGYEDIKYIILDTGSNYVLSNNEFPNGFNFSIGDLQIFVPSSLIRTGQVIAPNSIVIGNMILKNYLWEIDFVQEKLWAYAN